MIQRQKVKKKNISVEMFLCPANPLHDCALAIPASIMSKMTQDANKDKFRNYLEKARVLGLLIKSFVQVSPE